MPALRYHPLIHLHTKPDAWAYSDQNVDNSAPICILPSHAC